MKQRFTKEDWEICPRVKYQDLIYLWHDDYPPAPKSGVCLLNSRLYYFKYMEKKENLIKGNAEDYDTILESSIYVLFDMDEEQLKEILYWHALFEIYVGTHTNYIYEGSKRKRTGITHHEKGRMNVFYKKLKTRDENLLNFKKEQIIAWYQI